MLDVDCNEISKLENELSNLRTEIKGLEDTKTYYQAMLFKVNSSLEQIMQKETELVKGLEQARSLRNEKLIGTITEKLEVDNNFVILLEELLRQYASSEDTSLDTILDSAKV